MAGKKHQDYILKNQNQHNYQNKDLNKDLNKDQNQITIDHE